MYRETKELYEFGSFRLDVTEHTLTLSDGSKNYTLPEKAFQTLCVLVQKRGHLLTKQELLAEVWPDSFVEENNLDKCIHAIRQVLGEKPGEQKYIETVRKHGYRFVADVNVVATHSDGGTSVLDSEFLTEWPLDCNVNDRGPASIRERTWWTRRTVILVAIFFLAAAIGSAYYLYPAKEAAAKDRTEFAVLPVNPIDPANRSDLYEIGIADSLIQGLSSVKGFVVRPLSSTRKYTEIGQDPIAAGREQKVDYVLESSYQISDGRIKVTSQLLNVANGEIEETYRSETELTSVFAAQEAIAGSIRSKLMARFAATSSGPLSTRGTISEDAYRLYIQATVLADKRNQESSRKAIEYLEQAVRLDPNYALAYARLANAHSTLAYTGGSDDEDEEYLKGKAAIERALALDDNLAEAHSYLGEIKNYYDADLAGAEREDKRGIELDPHSSVAHCVYAVLLGVHGRTDESIAEIETALDLEPASAVNHQTYGWLLFFARRYDEAITESKWTLEIDPEYRFAYNVLTNSYHLKGDDDHAFEWLLRMEEPDDRGPLKAIYTRSGWRGVRETQFEDLKADEKKGNPNYNQLAFHSIELGQNEQAFTYLEKGIAQPHHGMLTLRVNPRFDPLRSDPRFDDLLRKESSD
jgi:DNA-binding winged helix-turn-helix (wHTH) protein/TolB-like protein/Tfp pilus assembly protein PilF